MLSHVWFSTSFKWRRHDAEPLIEEIWFCQPLLPDLQVQEIEALSCAALFVAREF